MFIRSIVNQIDMFGVVDCELEKAAKFLLR